jgi:hypothetical protein
MANIAHIEPGQVIPNDEEPAAGPPKQIEVTVTPQPKTRAQRRGNAKRTKKLVAELLDYIATGAPFNLACAAVNIHPDTFYDWRRADPSFARQVDQAVAKGQSAGSRKLRSKVKTAHAGTILVDRKTPSGRIRETGSSVKHRRWHPKRQQ